MRKLNGRAWCNTKYVTTKLKRGLLEITGMRLGGQSLWEVLPDSQTYVRCPHTCWHCVFIPCRPAKDRSVRRGLAPVPQCLFCPAPPGLTETGHCSRQDKDPRVGGRREGDVIPVLSREGGSPSLKRAEGSSQAKGPGSAAAFLRESSLSTRAHFWGEPARGPE